MTELLSVSQVLVWLSLLNILTALTSTLLFPQNGPMKVVLNRRRIMLYSEAFGIIFTFLYAAVIAGVIS